jgi:hypothetical protein
MLGFRGRVRLTPATPSGKPIGLPGNDECGGRKTSNIFSYLPLTTSLHGLYSPLSGPDERGERDRHVRGAGCGGRRRCGVTRFGGDVCLRAGRICASTATGKETAGFEMERLPRQCNGRLNRNASGQLSEAPCPFVDTNSGNGSIATAKRRQAEKTPYAERRALSLPRAFRKS